MEEISVQEAAGSPRVSFQSLETQSERLSPEPEFLQDTDMEQGLTGGACSSPRGKPRRPGSCAPDSQVPGVCDIRGCGCAPYSRGMGMPGPCSEGSLQRSDVRELWERGLAGHTSPSSHHPDS